MKRMTKNRIARMTAVFCAVLVATVMLSGCVTRIKPEPTVLEPVKYVYVKDGDTIGVTGMDGESFTVRLIGIDAPESVAPESYTEKTGKENSEYGEMAAEHLTLMLKDCDLLFLEYDEEQKDSYDRFLAYVYLSDSADITNSVNYKMLEDGYAVTMEIAPNVKYCKELKAAEEDAKNAGRGLWKYGDFMNSGTGK